MVRMASSGGRKHNGIHIDRSLSIFRGNYVADKPKDESYEAFKKKSISAKKRKGKQKKTLILKKMEGEK